MAVACASPRLARELDSVAEAWSRRDIPGPSPLGLSPVAYVEHHMGLVDTLCIHAIRVDAADIDMLFKVADSIGGKTVCPFGDAAIAPPQSSLAKFRAEFDYHVREKRCWKSVAPTFEQALAKSGAAVGA